MSSPSFAFVDLREALAYLHAATAWPTESPTTFTVDIESSTAEQHAAALASVGEWDTPAFWRMNVREKQIRNNLWVVQTTLAPNAMSVAKQTQGK